MEKEIEIVTTVTTGDVQKFAQIVQIGLAEKGYTSTIVPDGDALIVVADDGRGVRVEKGNL